MKTPRSLELRLLRLPARLHAGAATLAAVMLLAAFGSRPVKAAPRAFASTESIEYSEMDPTPTGSLRVASPTITWGVSPHGKNKVTAVLLQINGRTVKAAYDAARSRVIYVPETPLTPGAYAVYCKLTLDGVFDIDKNWQFTIATGAAPKLSDPDPVQTALCDEINAVRKRLNLPSLILDSRLCAAASNHSVYLSSNHGEAGHTESAGKAGFVAASTGERVNAFGYDGGCFETISQGITVSITAVSKLFDAPYHRLPFLQPGSFDVGTGMKQDVLTILFGATSASGVVTYPSDNQKDVPVSWSGNESPNPLRVHPGAHGPTGYAITLFAFGPDDPQLTVATATLADSQGRNIPVWINTPANDNQLRNGVMLIPHHPLAPNMTYRVSVNATDDIGTDRSHTWSFTTTAH